MPTPGAPNTTPGAVECLLPPVFSHAGGFVSNAFELTLTNPNAGGEIRFTLDGSEPAPGSALYEKAIPIRSRAGTPNELSEIPTVPGGWPTIGEVFKGWVVRARVFRTNALASPVATRSFWIDPAASRRYTLPVVSLATDAKNFFDPKIGIYVPGTTGKPNYLQHGEEWERPVHVELYETNGQPVLDQDAGVKIHGNTSQMAPIKGLDLNARFGAGRRAFHARLFPSRNRNTFKHLLLRPSGQDSGGAFMRDEVVQLLGSEAGLQTQAARPCIVFLNGEYWGLHYLKEKEGAEFVSFYGNVPKDGFDYLEGFATAKAGDTEHYDALVKFLAVEDPALPANYARIQTWIEVPDFINFKVCEIFNYRWDLDNHRLWRPRTQDGRWRWLQWDNDVSWGGFWTESPPWGYDMLAAELSIDGRLHGHNSEQATLLLRRLLLNPDFRRDFINRFADLLNTVLRPAHTIDVVDALASRLASEMPEHCRRWRAPASAADWQRAVDDLREYARRRPDFCRQHLMRRFKLPGTAQLILRVQPRGSGSIQLNSLDVAPAADAPWVGIYFQGNPVRLTARPQPGWRFAGWDGLPEANTNSLDLLLNSDRTVAARFEPSQSLPEGRAPARP
jgi:hypothetical protein